MVEARFQLTALHRGRDIGVGAQIGASSKSGSTGSVRVSLKADLRGWSPSRLGNVAVLSGISKSIAARAVAQASPACPLPAGTCWLGRPGPTPTKTGLTDHAWTYSTASDRPLVVVATSPAARPAIRMGAKLARIALAGKAFGGWVTRTAHHRAPAGRAAAGRAPDHPSPLRRPSKSLPRFPAKGHFFNFSSRHSVHRSVRRGNARPPLGGHDMPGMRVRW